MCRSKSLVLGALARTLGLTHPTNQCRFKYFLSRDAASRHLPSGWGPFNLVLNPALGWLNRRERTTGDGPKDQTPFRGHPLAGISGVPSGRS